MKKFKVGDRVRVRSWDDMVKEFERDTALETNDVIYIHTPLGFLNNMRHLVMLSAGIIFYKETLAYKCVKK